MKFLRSCAVVATLALAGCGGQAPPDTGATSPLPPFGGGPAGAPGPAAGASAKPVALLLPLTGPMAPVGQALANAAKLAFGAGGPTLDIRDTGGVASGAASAAQAAITGGDGLILGPLTSGETHAVAPIAAAAGLNVLAFTNDSSVAAPGVWALGLTPAQQVQRVVQAAVDAGHSQFAALLPDDEFGHALGDALGTAVAAAGAGTPSVTYFSEGSFGAINQAVRQVSDFADRGQSIEDQIKKAQELNTDAGRDTARQLQLQPIPPPVFTVLFIGSTSGETLAEIATLLPYYDVSQPQVQFIGPALWAQLGSQLSGAGVYNGALYAAPDPAAAGTFQAKYQGSYGGPPPAIANIGFDAAAIARLAAADGYTATALTDPAGYSGSDGPLLLQPDGQVRRGLAVFRVAPGGAVLSAPAPMRASPPNS